MGGPDRQTTPRTGLDDFVAGLLKYGTLGYLPPDVMSQLYPPVPGVGGQTQPPPGLGGGNQPGGDIQALLGGPMALPPVQGDAPAPPPPGYPPTGGFNYGFPPGYNPPPGYGTGTATPQQPSNTVPGGAMPFDIGQFIQGRLSIPQYGGQFTAPTNALQNTAAAGAGSALSSFFGQQAPQPGRPFQPPSIQPPIMGGNAWSPPAAGMMSAFGMPPQAQPQPQPPGGNFTGPGAGVTMGSDIISQLFGRGTQTSQTPERSLLDMLGMQGPQANLAAAFQALDAQRRTGLAQDTRDLREQFSFSGNRFGTDLANAIGQRQSQSEQNFLAQAAPLAAQVAPQSFGQQVSALGTAGQLGQGAGQQSLEALLGLPGAFSQTSLLPGQVAGQGFNLGEQLRSIMQGDTAAKQAEFTRTQGALFPTLLQYAAGAPQIYTPGIGQQLLGTGAGLGGAALGAK